MRQLERRRGWRRTVSAGVAGVLVVTGLALPAAANAADAPSLLTDYIVEINETVSDAGFVHPGVGLSADDLRHAQEQVRAGVDPWTTYFAAMTDTPFAAKDYRASNSKSAAQPDVPLDPTFVQAGMRNRETNDSFGALTQSLMWVMTGDETYRRNAVQVLRTWGNMDPTRFTYFADAHIHTGHPLYQFLMAAEIIRATEPVADDTPGTHTGYDVVWSAEDDRKLLENFANPVVEKFLYSNTRWMNQHNFGLFGRIATAIYADDPVAYATGVEWLTVNSTYDGYDNGAMAPQMPLIAADNPLNPYGRSFVQVREMGRDQAHGETNIDNYTGLARMLEVQGTKVDKTAGTVSTAANAVSVYDFLDRRLLAGADTFYAFMMGGYIPWVDERGDGWNGTVSQAYRGRLFNPTNELYYEYVDRGVNVAKKAPWLKKLSDRMDGPYFFHGTGLSNFWSPGDKNPEYWVAFPASLAGTTPKAKPETSDLSFAERGLTLDKRSEVVSGGSEKFVRAHLNSKGTTMVIDRIMHDSKGTNGIRLRTDGAAQLEILNKEPVSGSNPNELAPTVIATIQLPDTHGAWRYVTFPEFGDNVAYFTLTGKSKTTVDLDHVRLQADSTLAPLSFPAARPSNYLTAGDAASISAAVTGRDGQVSYSASGLPKGAVIDESTGTLSWVPKKKDAGRYSVTVFVDDGVSVASKTVELVVSANRKSTIAAVLADRFDADNVYTTVTRGPFDAARAEAEAASRAGNQTRFEAALTALESALDGLRLLNPTLADGSLDYRGGVATPVGIAPATLDLLADGLDWSSTGDLRIGSFVVDFGPQYRVKATQFGFQARFTFGNRLEGTNAYGSNDGITWDLLTEHPTENANDYQRIAVDADHTNTAYRYFKIQVDEPGVPTDPAYPGIWSFGELGITGERVEVPGAITAASVSAPGSVLGRVVAGSNVQLSFSASEPISEVTASVGGQAVAVSSTDGKAWTGSVELGALTGNGKLDVVVDHKTAAGVAAATLHGTTDGTSVFGSDETNLIDLAGLTLVDASGAPTTAQAADAAKLLDSNASTFSDFAPVNGAAALTWDAGQDALLDVDRLDVLARRDNNGMIRIGDIRVQGSNDLNSWQDLAGGFAKSLDWQGADVTDEGAYRYIRVTSSSWLNLAELRVFGTLEADLEALLVRADETELGAYSLGSQLLFTREVEAVRAAASQPDADTVALGSRLLAAWDLLEAAPAAALASIVPEWVVASTGTADGIADPAANGWRLFDGNAQTWTDTTTKSCTVTITPDDGTVFRIESVNFLPRSSAVPRSTGMSFEGSNDGGLTWTSFGSTGTPAAGWNARSLATPQSFDAVRLSGGNGYCNVAELQLVVTTIDQTALDVATADASALNADEWTPATWQVVSGALNDAATVRADKGASQATVNDATDTLLAAISELQHA